MNMIILRLRKNVWESAKFWLWAATFCWHILFLMLCPRVCLPTNSEPNTKFVHPFENISLISSIKGKNSSVFIIICFTSIFSKFRPYSDGRNPTMHDAVERLMNYIHRTIGMQWWLKENKKSPSIQTSSRLSCGIRNEKNVPTYQSSQNVRQMQTSCRIFCAHWNEIQTKSIKINRYIARAFVDIGNERPYDLNSVQTIWTREFV